MIGPQSNSFFTNGFQSNKKTKHIPKVFYITLFLLTKDYISILNHNYFKKPRKIRHHYLYDNGYDENGFM